MRKRVAAAVLAVLVAVAILVTVFHNAAIRFALSTIVPLATGYSVWAADVRLESRHAALVDVHVTHGGQTVLDAGRIDVYYNPRDLLPGSKHRFGLLAVTIDRPHITIVHNQNGTYNVSLPRAVSGGTGRRAPNNVPLDFTVRVRDASATLTDAYRYYENSRVLGVDHINLDASLNTATKMQYTVSGFLRAGGRQPFRIAGVIDYAQGFAMHHVHVRAIPITAIGNYFIDSPVAHVLSGTVDDFDLRAWNFEINPNAPGQNHLAGAGFLHDGSMFVRSLDSPIRHIEGRVEVFDSGFAMRRATASVGHIPIVFAGGMFDFRNPQFRLGVDGRGDLRNLQEVAHFAKGLPIFGGVRIHALVEGDIGQPLLLVAYSGKRFNYGAVPIDDPQGAVALLASRLIVLPFHGYYDGIHLHLQGTLDLSGAQVQSTLALHADGPSPKLPYLGAMVSAQTIETEALLTGTDVRFDARGYLVSLAQPGGVNGFFDLNRNGAGVFGPVEIRTPGGGSLVAGYALDRPHGESAFWASLYHMNLHQPVPVVLPGVNIPQLPPIDAHVDEAYLAGTGSGQNVVVGGAVYMSPATISGVPFYSIGARFAGPFAAAKISSVHADGPWGTFDGNGTFAPNVIVARGGFSGTFEGLRMFLGGFPVHGGISGPMAIAIAQSKIYVQAQNAQLQHADMHGIPISTVSGTMVYDNGILKVYAAQAHAAGGEVVAAGSFATTPSSRATRLSIATTTLDARQALHGFGVPISGGALRAVGSIAPGAAIPDLDAGVVLGGGSAMGFSPVAASADVSIENDTLHLQNTLAALGRTFSAVSGTMSDLASGRPSYALNANVPVGEIGAMTRYAQVPTYHAQGSFGGSFRIGGTGVSPSVSGTIDVPVGSVNGLGFSDARASIRASRGGIDVQHGFVRVGSTAAQFSASVAKASLGVELDSAHADLSDFNDFFDTGDTLAGSGRIALAFTHFGRVTLSSGDIDVRGLRYKRFPIGDTSARWAGVRDLVQGRVDVGGLRGRLTATGTIGFAAGASLPQVIARSRYNVDATLSDLDLNTWLPTLGFTALPITGRVEGNARIHGAYPHLQIAGSASLRDGTVGPLAIQSADVSAQSAPGDRIEVSHFAFALPSLQGTGSGSFGITPTAPMNFSVHAVTDDFPRLVAQVAKKELPIRGHLESTLSVGGTLAAPRVSAGVDGTNLVVYGLRIPSFVGQVQVHRHSVVVRNSEITFARGTVAIAGSLPLQFAPFGFGAPDAPIAMDATARDLDLAPFGPLLGNGTTLGGTLNGHIGISGTVGNPRILGQVGGTNVSYVSNLDTIPVTQTIAQLTFDGTGATLDRLHARLGRGLVDGSGDLNFGRGLNGGPLGYRIALRARGAQIAVPQLGSGTFDAALNLSRSGGSLAHVSGNAALTDTIISFNSLLALSGGASAPSGPPPFNAAFDVRIHAGKNVSVRSGGVGLFGLDISGQGDVHLTGTLLHPEMAGVFNSAGGTLTLIDRAFKIDQGRVTFTPANGALPDIYAIATTRVFNPDPDTARNPTGSTEITARVAGIVPAVKISFSSSPGTYTDQQIIALLLPLGGLVGPIQFTDTGVVLPAGQLSGAPAPGSGAPLPNIFVARENGTVTIGQEAFNILNAQFATGLLSPLENALSNSLGLSDVNLTVDYGGNVGVTLRRPFSSDLYAVYGTTFGVPIRQTYGFAYQPNAFTSAQFTMFFQQGPTPLFLGPTQTLSSNTRLTAGQAVTGTSGFTFLFQRLF